MIKLVLDSNVTALLRFLNENEAAGEIMDQLVAEPVVSRNKMAISRVVGVMMGRVQANREWLAKLLEVTKDLPPAAADLIRGPSLIDELPDYLAPLVDRGILGSVRRCDVCDQWMFARRKDQRACSALCAHKKYEQKPDAKERRNAYMRWRYKMNTSGVWLDSRIPKNRWPTFEQWLEQKEPTPREWQTVLNAKKGHK